MKRSFKQGFFGRSRLSLIFFAVPALFLVSMILKFHVNVPYYDEWEIPPKLEKMYSGTIAFHDLWVQHNEHRMVFPRVIILIFAALSSWDLLWEELFNVALAAGTFLLIAGLIRRTRTFTGESSVFWLTAVASSVVFSLRQWENWTWGFEMVYFMSVFGAVAGIAALSDLRFSWKKWILAFLCGVLSVYSFSSGFVFWPVGFFLLSISRFRTKRLKSAALVLWVLGAALVMGAYLYGYKKPPKHPSLFYIFQSPLESMKYFLTYMGSALVVTTRAHWAGAVGTVLFFFTSLFLFFKKKAKRELSAGFVALGLFSIGNGLVTTVGRAGFHVEQALTSRYVTISYPFWIAVIVLTTMVLKNLESRAPIKFFDAELSEIFRKFLCVVIFYLLIKGNYYSIEPMRQRSELLKRAIPELSRLTEDADHSLLNSVNPKIEVLKKGSLILKNRNVSFFKK